MPAAQTIKQAKASFAARGRPSLNTQEQRRLERGLELEQRAERAKEAERRRVAAAKKRAESEKKNINDREEAFLGTQRRKDRFGYMSSQFHLGTFLVGGGKNKKKDEAMVVAGAGAEEEDLFGDDGLDDEVMLNALNVAPVEYAQSDSAVLEKMIMPLPPVRGSQSASMMDDLMDDFWDDMGSSTQIARELGGGVIEVNMSMSMDMDMEGGREMEVTGKTKPPRSASFDSVDFDLTAEDLDHLDPPNNLVKEVTIPLKHHAMPPPPPVQIQMMLPPALPSRPTQRPAQSKMSSTTMGPPLPKSLKTTTRPPALRPTPATLLPAGSVPTTPSPMNTMAGPEISIAQISRITTPIPQRTTLPSPPRRLHDPMSQQMKSRTAIRGPFLPASSLYCSPDLGFTLTQLEGFFDDDIQLTQAMPG